MPVKVILDVDTGVDDAVAIMLALSSPEIEVLGITTVSGNVGVDRATENTLKVLEFLGREDVPVAPGARAPLLPPPTGVDERVHGRSGLGGARLPEPTARPLGEHAVDFIRRVVGSEGPGEVVLVTTAPMTNVALSFLVDPSLPERLGGVVSMGGAFCTSRLGCGNSTPRAEFNVWCDPLAARVVYRSGAEVRAVGLDVTMREDASLTRAQVEGLRSRGRVGALLADMLSPYAEAIGRAPLHDPMAVATLIRPEIFRFEEMCVDVELFGDLTRGETVADLRERGFEVPKGEPNVSVCVDVDGPAFLDLLLERVLGGG
ncbi:MAG: ribonucleoside hydrolase [Thermoproteota archaeon]|nr:MAG: ribonucleoside hydrolase [Candidatus Korarchaeota archaeon]